MDGLQRRDDRATAARRLVDLGFADWNRRSVDCNHNGILPQKIYAEAEKPAEGHSVNDPDSVNDSG
jgi:hypothetical protein